MASIAPTSALLRVGVLGQLVAAAFFAAALGAGIWVAMGSESPIFAFWDTALRFFTWGLLALGLSWTGDSFAGKRHHPGFLRAGALVVVVSPLVLWWQAAGFEHARFLHLDRVVWVGGAASLVFLLAQMLDYSRGRPLARIGLVKMAGVAIILAGIGIGVWAVYFWNGERVSVVGRGTHWYFFWSWFQLKGLFGLLTIGFAHLAQGLEASRTLGQSSSAKNVLRTFGGWGLLVAAVFFSSAVGGGIWQAMGSQSAFAGGLEATQRLCAWGLLILGLVWIGDGFGGRRHHPDFLRTGALLVVASGIALGWRSAGPLGNAYAWHVFSFEVLWAVAPAILIFLLAQTLDYSRGRPLARIGLIQMAGTVIVVAGVSMGIWSCLLAVNGNSNIWYFFRWEFWGIFSIPGLFGVLMIGFAEVVQGIEASRAVAQREPETTEPQTAP